MIKDVEIKQWVHKNKDNKASAIAKVLGVEYVHITLPNRDDLYVTGHGLPFIEHLKPDQFLTDKKWFKTHSIKLAGTSSVYKVTTKKIHGKYKDIVIKWNRMGQDIPGDPWPYTYPKSPSNYGEPEEKSTSSSQR